MTSADQKDRGPVETTHLNVNNGSELRYWAKELNVSLEQVKSAVRKVGPLMTDIRAELERQGLGRRDEQSHTQGVRK